MGDLVKEQDLHLSSSNRRTKSLAIWLQNTKVRIKNSTRLQILFFPHRQRAGLQFLFFTTGRGNTGDSHVNERREKRDCSSLYTIMNDSKSSLSSFNTAIVNGGTCGLPVDFYCYSHPSSALAILAKNSRSCSWTISRGHCCIVGYICWELVFKKPSSHGKEWVVLSQPVFLYN